MNPQGGVPYGVNQDGSQNMVEEGEVSVGNNVFSYRIAISPELYQQLGLNFKYQLNRNTLFLTIVPATLWIKRLQPLHHALVSSLQES